MGYLSLIQTLPGLREHHGRGNRKKSLRAGDSSLPQILKGWTSQQNLITSKSDWPAKGGCLTLYGFVLYGQCLPFLPLRRREIAMSTSQGFWIVTVITQGVMSYPPAHPRLRRNVARQNETQRHTQWGASWKSSEHRPPIAKLKSEM